ncbi:NAD(+) synthase [uncultured Ruminococcus sp.]|uniref:NAD(+) synthase n=1 Tax=uncultured Ruminococcus sp. TaxID=165186 RepID=UPI003454F52F
MKIACATPDLRVADCAYNGEQIVRMMREAAQAGAALTVFPELCITGYTCLDLFLQDTLLEGALDTLFDILTRTEELDMLAVIGLPIAVEGKLFNCAAVCQSGQILGIVPKLNIPNYGEFQELRYFTPGNRTVRHCSIHGRTCAVGADMRFTCVDMPAFSFGVEICEDVWVGDSPSNRLAAQGAVLIVNLSASDETIGKAAYRKKIIEAKSGSLFCAYAYADAGIGESTTDMVFAGHNLIAESGTTLGEAQRFTGGLLYGDIDLQKLTAERRRTNTAQSAADPAFTEEFFDYPLRETRLERQFPATPFVPVQKNELDDRCGEILQMQAVGLMTRLRHIHCKDVVIGLSGGLDSTLALIVTVMAFDRLGLPRTGIHAITMPCFGTTDRTYQNACGLARAYGTDLREIPIRDSVLQHFADIGHDPACHDVTYENGQARERTQVLMDFANQCGGIVIGTGDLSELALGWATYNGDHMSMYGVNASVPKTLVRYLVAHTAEQSDAKLREVLLDVLDTPVSPELLPPEESGEIRQKTEDLVGPYLLHDFFLYHMVRFSMPPTKIFRMACIAFSGQFAPDVILKWERIFYRRFFSQQFKRSCLPDGVKIGSVTLSPRGDWRMPSDACADQWLRQLEQIKL